MPQTGHGREISPDLARRMAGGLASAVPNWAYAPPMTTEGTSFTPSDPGIFRPPRGDSGSTASFHRLSHPLFRG